MGTAVRAAPSRCTRGRSKQRAFRSHRAVSTAEMAQAAIPERPILRTARCMAFQQAGMSKLLLWWIASASRVFASEAAEASAYVYPMPDCPPASTVTTTSVVEFHANVPSASGRSVGMRSALALRPAIGAPAASLIFVVASGQDGAQHLPGRIPDDASLARVTFNERLGEVQ